MVDAVQAHELVIQLGWVLLHFLWQGSLVAIALLLTLRFQKGSSSNAKYAFACSALIVMTACPVITFIGLSPTHVGEPVQAFGQRAVPAKPTFHTSSFRTVPKTVPVATLEPVRGPETFLPTIVAFWITGVGVLSLRMLGGLVVVERVRLKFSEPAPLEWQGRLDDLAIRLGMQPRARLLVSPKVEVPTTIGVFRACVILPLGFLTRLSPENVEAILAHELAHIRRNDYLFNLLQTVAETVLFFHPAVWWVTRTVRAERENCCDDIAVQVVGDPLRYARALTRLEEGRRSMPLPSLSAQGGSLMNRIVRLVQPTPQSSRVSPVWLAAVSFSVGALLLGASIQVGASAIPNKVKVTQKIVKVNYRGQANKISKDVSVRFAITKASKSVPKVLVVGPVKTAAFLASTNQKKIALGPDTSSEFHLAEIITYPNQGPRAIFNRGRSDRMVAPRE